MTYPLKFRKHVLLTRKEKKLTLKETAIQFNIGLATLTRWSKDITPKTYPLRMYKINLDELLADVIANPYSYQSERASKFNVTQKAIWKALKLLNITCKKNSAPSSSGRTTAYAVHAKDVSL